MSVAGPRSPARPAACSGLMKAGVPTAAPATVSATPPTDEGRSAASSVPPPFAPLLPITFANKAAVTVAARGGSHLERIVVKDGTRVHIIPVSKLDYAEAQDDYVLLSSGGKTYLKQQTISSLEALLDPRQFVRIHRSYLINLERLVKMEPYSKDSRVAVLSDGKQLPVSRAGYQRLAALLGEGV